MRTLLGSVLVAASCLGQSYGTWKMDAALSTFNGETRPKSVTVRIEQHPKGEVLTVDRLEIDGRTISSSTVLYLDGVPREFQDFECSGTQSSRRVNSDTVEILRACGSGNWMRLVRRSTTQRRELVLEITEQHADGRHFERRLVLDRQ